MHNAENEHFVVVEPIRVDAWEILRLSLVLRREAPALEICRAHRWRVESIGAK